MSDTNKTIEINFGVKLKQNDRGLKFGTDALLLSAFMRQRKFGRACDLGAGSGVISLLSLANNKFQSITAVEIQPEYASLCRENAELNGLSERMPVLCRDIRELSSSELGGEVDAVFSNPPYMTVGSGKTNEDEGKYIARHEVCGGIADFCKCASRLLKNGGYFYSVWRPDRLCDLICSLREADLEPKRIIFVHRDRDHIPSLMLTEAKKGALPSAFVTKPLIMYENDRETDDLRYIYETGEFNEQYKKS